jgi:6-phosphogluconolactonase
MEIVVVDHPAQVVGERLAEAGSAGGHLVLTGGSAAGPAYEQAARLEPDWSKTDLWWGDERCVPPDDDLSNYKLARDTLLDKVTTGAVHRMQGELGCDVGAARYEEELGALDRFDLVLLGLGPDGHVASLFPNQPTLDERERRAIGAEAKLEPYVDRITLTLPMLNAARLVVFIVSGESKADAVKRAFADEPSPATPGSLVRGEETLVVLDPPAATKLG